LTLEAPAARLGRASSVVESWLFMPAFIDRLSFSTRVVVVVFIFLIVAAVIFELEIPSWEKLVALI
jgi:hypothetical protein